MQNDNISYDKHDDSNHNYYWFSSSWSSSSSRQRNGEVRRRHVTSVLAVNSYTCDEELTHISTWVKRNNLKLYLGKSKEILFWARLPGHKLFISRLIHDDRYRVLAVWQRWELSSTIGYLSLTCRRRAQIMCQTMYALRILRAHGVPANSLHDVFNAIVLSKILSCSPLWSCYCSAADHNRLDAFMRVAAHDFKLNAITNMLTINAFS